MTELTDLEVTKRIAKIMNVDARDGVNCNYLIEYEDNNIKGVFSPLRNGKIICDLIEKYKIWIGTDNFGQIWAEIYDDDGYSKGAGIDKDLKRAVCLCLIEAFSEDLK